MEWREQEGVRWLEVELDGARAAFSTRLGGVSEPPFDSLNLGLLTDDAEANVVENRRRLATALGFAPDQVAFARQVHGTDLVEHPSEVREADGHVVREPGIAPLVFVADCLPVVLAGPKGVAMVHAGWHGLAGGILAAGAEAVEATSAAIGPGIGPCCYEVGPEVLEAFSDLGDGVAAGRMLDLPEVARRQLARAGVERVESAGLCTGCEEELFFSHRRDDGRTGRQAGLAWLEA
ncbi:MAG TPA: polyphenol oxidase family protein [Solirubrobacterales bacterium]|jgi:YfiH family protein|nr:polyphenol oxidase family protein [Solirubrobacterales bacterium]